MDKLYRINIVGTIKRTGMVVATEMEIISVMEMRNRRNIMLPISLKDFGTRWRLR